MQLLTLRQTLLQLLFSGILVLWSCYAQTQADTIWVKLTSDTTYIDQLSGPHYISVLKGSIPSNEIETLWEPPAIIAIAKRNTFNQKPDSVQIRALPLNVPELRFAHKDTSLIGNTANAEFTPYVVGDKNGQLDDQGDLNKSGSLSRGIIAGNNQDLSVNSALNLQLSGKITDDISVLASITDDNLPIQPDGNSQQLQDFDQVYVKLYNQRGSLLAGDYQITENRDHFLRFQKRARGANLEMTWAPYSLNSDSTFLQAGVAISKGKFARNVVQGIEGNQGPYRLTGAENELFIIVLSGTERVFIDGQLLKRGRNEDYVIDYNSAEITFMPKRRITKDRRIVVEFQYSDRNYARTMVQSAIEGAEGNWKWRINGYTEQDSRNQPLQQTLDAADRSILRDAGDNLLSAFRQGIDSVGFDESIVAYALVDSLGYDSVLVRSDNPDIAHYRAQFSFVGSGNGNYVEDGFTANGRAFRWVAPDTISGILQRRGSYEPIQLLVSPKLQQMATGDVTYEYGENQKIRANLAVSRSDLNTFSELNNSDDTGVGVFFDWRHEKQVKKGHSITARASHEYISQYFSSIERFRAVEFDRNWNIRG
ncbi:MAG: hypothetical protein AAF193_02725, partial [Bacteroidota bacterium]